NKLYVVGLYYLIGRYLKIMFPGRETFMKTSILYGQGELTIEVPHDSLIIEPTDLPSIEDENQAVKDGLINPICTPPLKTMVQSDETVAIVISDITRPTPNHILVPEIIDTLNHVPLENFVIING